MVITSSRSDSGSGCDDDEFCGGGFKFVSVFKSKCVNQTTTEKVIKQG